MSPQTQTKYFQYWRVYSNLRQILFGPRAELELGKIIWGRGETIDELVGGKFFFEFCVPQTVKSYCSFINKLLEISEILSFMYEICLKNSPKCPKLLPKIF